MTAKFAVEVPSGSDFHSKPEDGTHTLASTGTAEWWPVKRKCRLPEGGLLAKLRSQVSADV